MTALSLPKRPKGRPRAAQNACFDLDLAAWCAGILEINSTLDFRISSRGWCYILEEKGGLLKGDFDVAQKRINACRKSGLLPLDICCDDDGRAADGLEYLDVADVEKMATHLLRYVTGAHRSYDPISFWETQPKYIEMATEKIDLKSLFSRECRPYHLPITNFSGWTDINSRAAMMKRFAYWETRGKECVLLYCGDHDPGGLHISEFICSNFADLTGAVGWSPEHLIIERFGLDYDFIVAQGLTWIENLETGSGKYPLNDARHPDHFKPYVQSYLRQFGARKCEANALVTRPVAGRGLCRRAIFRHIDSDAILEYERQLADAREELRLEIRRQLEEGALSL
ncbi:MAG: hypothetical protein CR217_11565 [Beijerinckiaceae bacterium]|nr:MAG: hypothetical protein CR217_11565 [Beijerinckiaceae bacterium]